MQITNIDLNTPAGHKILYAMNDMRAKITTKSGKFTIGVLAVHAQRHPHVTINVSEDGWEAVRVDRADVATLEYIPEP